MRLLAGARILDRYLVDAFLDEGGMGQVYRGHHASLGFLVAVKVLGDQSPETMKRFEREARLMARVRHPNVVSVLDFGLVGDQVPCIVMEHVDGESLEGRIARRGALPWQEAVDIAAGILAGLDAIHAAAILHRDLKPSNVLLAAGAPEIVKVIDFGIARPEGTAVTQYTRTGAVIGTPGYMAPERLMNLPVDVRSDLYAVGLMLHEMLTGSLPFGGKTMESVLRRAVLPVPPPTFPSAHPQPSPGLVRLMMESLSIEASGRPATARAFATRLSEASRQDSNLSGPPSRPAPGMVSRPAAPTPTPAAVVPAAQASSARPGPRNSPGPTPRELADEFGPTLVDAPPPASSVQNLLIGARLPPSRLTSSEERRWLGEVGGDLARAFTLGGAYWFAVLPVGGDLARARKTAESILAALQGRYGAMVRVEWGIAQGEFAMSAAALSGAAPLPTEIRTLLERLTAS